MDIAMMIAIGCGCLILGAKLGSWVALDSQSNWHIHVDGKTVMVRKCFEQHDTISFTKKIKDVTDDEERGAVLAEAQAHLEGLRILQQQTEEMK